MIVDNWDRFANQFMDIFDIALFFPITERQCHSFVCGPAGASDTVYIRLWLVGDLKIDHVRELIYIQSSGGDIGCYKYAGLLRFKIRQSSLSIVLRLIAVNRLGFDSGIGQKSSDLISSIFRTGKNKRRRNRMVFENMS